MSVATPPLETRSVQAAGRPRAKIGTIISYIALVLLAIIFLVPYYLIFRNALLTQPQILSFKWVWLPIPPHFENLQALFADQAAPMAIGLRNSAAVAIIQTVGQIFIA